MDIGAIHWRILFVNSFAIKPYLCLPFPLPVERFAAPNLGYRLFVRKRPNLDLWSRYGRRG